MVSEIITRASGRGACGLGCVEHSTPIPIVIHFSLEFKGYLCLSGRGGRTDGRLVAGWIAGWRTIGDGSMLSEWHRDRQSKNRWVKHDGQIGVKSEKLQTDPLPCVPRTEANPNMFSACFSAPPCLRVKKHPPTRCNPDPDGTVGVPLCQGDCGRRFRAASGKRAAPQARAALPCDGPMPSFS